MKGVFTSSKPNSSSSASTSLETPKVSVTSPTPGVTRKRTKKKRGTLDLTSLVQRDAVALQRKQGQRFKAPLTEVKIEPSDDVISNVLTNHEMGSASIHIGPVPDTNALDATSSSMKEIIDLTNDDEDYPTSVKNLEKVALLSNPADVCVVSWYHIF